MILTKHARSFRNLIMGGGSNVEGESLSCQLHFRSARKTKKNASAQSSLKFREVSNGFREGTRREKTRLKKVSYRRLPSNRPYQITAHPLFWPKSLAEGSLQP